MANAGRWSLSPRQGFLACGLVTAGLFLLPCGTAMDNIPVAALGVAVGLLGPIVIVLSSVRANRPDIVGTAHVSQSSAPPTTGVTGPADLQLVVNATGVHNAVVRIRDANVPVSKWPDIGANLPVLIPNGSPRRLQVLWDRVRAHHDLPMHDVSYTPYLEEGYPDEGYVDENYVDENYVDEVADDGGYAPVEPIVEQTPVTEPLMVDESPARRAEPAAYTEAPLPAVVASTAPVPQAATVTPVPESVVGVRRRPSPRPRRETAPEPTSSLPRRVPGATRTEPANGIPTPPTPADEAETADEVRMADKFEAFRPDPYVASYLADDPEDAEQGLGGVHNVSVTVIVSDLRRSLTFYRDLLGLTEIDGGMGSAILVSGNARILLRQVADTRPVDRRVVHLNLEVDDVHEAYERLRRQGVEFMHAPRVVDQGEQLEQWAATLRDPDGHAIALTHWEVRP